MILRGPDYYMAIIDAATVSVTLTSVITTGGLAVITDVNSLLSLIPTILEMYNKL